MVLEFHLQSNFNIFGFGHLYFRDSFEFFEVEKESPFFVFGSLFAEFLEFLLIVEEELLMFGLFGLDSLYCSLSDVHKFGKLSFNVDECVFGLDELIAKMANIAQTFLFHVGNILKLFPTILQMRNQLINQLICH